MAETARVLIVDDSRLYRAVIEQALAGAEGLAVAGSVYSGERALDFIRQSPPDVVTLDVEMAGLNGLQTLEAIQQINAGRSPGSEIGVVMVSSHCQRGADVTVRALQAGAFDFVTKPSGPCEAVCQEQLRSQLLCKIRLFLARRGRQPRPACPCPVKRRWVGSGRGARAVLIACSTGGPRALEALLVDLRPRTDLPVLVVQHMPPTFTRSLADSLARRLGTPVIEAADGAAVQPGQVYIAPGGKHLLLRCESGRLVLGTNEQPPEERCRPSANVLFRSAAAALGGDAVAVVLTGMGTDGTAGLATLKRAGAYVIAQDEATSVVWGMPGSVVEAGLADEVLPLEKIAAAVQDVVASRRPR